VLDIDISANVGAALVYTSENQGHSPEQMAEMALSKMILVAEDANPLIRDQAIEYQKQLREILIYYMKKMAASERTTIWALMRSQGHEDMAEIIRRL
tara:strand:+ start:82 stop:372 length:291 start_codon:yes stop_codon:yes gene_type:complete